MSTYNQKKGLKRKVLDKFYTKPTVVNFCIKKVSKFIQIHKKDLILEPSGGEGAFLEGIKSLGKNYVFYDVMPENKEIIKHDFLTLDVEPLVKSYQRIHVIGNPPFGRQSSLAIKFIKKSCTFCKIISFILPKSFKKESLKKVFPLNFHLLAEFDLNRNAFLLNGGDYNVPTVFQIWIQKDYNRQSPRLEKPVNFRFVKKGDNPQISFRRVGVYAGQISTQKINEKSDQSHYFIKFLNMDSNNELIQELKKIMFSESLNTVGPRSISKQELIVKFNKIIEKRQK